MGTAVARDERPRIVATGTGMPDGFPCGLLSDRADFFLVCGAPAACLAAVLAASIGAGIDFFAQLDRVVLGIGLLVNYPHFIASYLLLYSDYRAKLLGKREFFLVSTVVPAILLAWILLGMTIRHSRLLPYLVFLFFFLGGWHYAKQIYGVVVVIGNRRGFFLRRWEKWSLLIHLHCLWLLAWVPRQIPDWLPPRGRFRQEYFFGVPRITLGFPREMLGLSYGLLILSFAWFAATLIRKYRRDASVPPFHVVAAYLGGLLLMLPVLWYPLFLAVIPALHSLQYVPFVAAFKKNQGKQALAALEPAAARAGIRKRLAVYFGWSVALGAIGFEILPRWLDSVFGTAWPDGHGFSFFIPFWIFLNLHHFCIDAVIWKGSLPEVRAYLLARPAAVPASAHEPLSASR